MSCSARPFRLTATVVGLACALVLLLIPTSAYAGSNTYCWGVVLSAGQNCGGPRHSLRQNHALNYYGNNSYLVAASALTTYYQQYGSWVYGYGQVCHSYSGQNILHPWMYNPESSRGQTMGGVEYWGSEPACP